MLSEGHTPLKCLKFGPETPRYLSSLASSESPRQVGAVCLFVFFFSFFILFPYKGKVWLCFKVFLLFGWSKHFIPSHSSESGHQLISSAGKGPLSPPSYKRGYPRGFPGIPAFNYVVSLPVLQKCIFLLNVILTIKLLSCSNTFLCTLDIWDY